MPATFVSDLSVLLREVVLLRGDVGVSVDAEPTQMLGDQSRPTRLRVARRVRLEDRRATAGGRSPGRCRARSGRSRRRPSWWRRSANPSACWCSCSVGRGAGAGDLLTRRDRSPASRPSRHPSSQRSTRRSAVPGLHCTAVPMTVVERVGGELQLDPGRLASDLRSFISESRKTTRTRSRG